MTLTIRLFLAAGLVALSQLLVYSIGAGMAPDVAQLPTVGQGTLPTVVGEFTGHDEPIDERLVRAADAAQMLNRVYENQLGDRIVVNVGLWTYYHVQIPHTPDICYPGAGWDISSRDSMQVKTDDGRTFDARLYVFQKEMNRIAVLYWAHLNNQVVTDDEAVRKVRQSLRGSGKPLPLLVKVMLQTDASDLPAARARLERMAVELFPTAEAIR